MTTRHTITHADELYAGNAFLQGDVGGTTVGSPDGRRGLPITHTYVREYGAILAGDDDGICDSYVGPSTAVPNFIPFATGVYLLAVTTAGVTQLTMDVPRNLTFMCTATGTLTFRIEGQDEYGQAMAETVLGTAIDTTYSSGLKAFKVVDKIYTTWAVTGAVSIGAGTRIGLPYHLSSLDKMLGYYVDGMSASLNASVATGLALATDATSTTDDPDVRGTIKTATAPNATIKFSAMMIVDHTTRDKAYGVPQASAIT